MPNVALKTWLWQRLPDDAKVYRELWSLNGGTYEGYRAYIQHVKDCGFPEEPAEVGHRVTGRQTPPPDDERSSAPPYAFEHAFSSSTVPVTSLRFGRLTPGLLAWGDEGGAVTVAATPFRSATPRVLHVLRGVHSDAVTDLDWSLDNGTLASCSVDGRACIWNVVEGAPIRVLVVFLDRDGRPAVEAGNGGDGHGRASPSSSPSGALVGLTAIRLHPTNQNLVVLGLERAGVVVANGGSGRRVAAALAGVAVAALEVVETLATPVLVVLAADVPTLHVLRADLQEAGCHAAGPPLRALQTVDLPGVPRAAGGLALELVAWTAFGDGKDGAAALAVTTLDGTLSLLRVAGASQGSACASDPGGFSLWGRREPPVVDAAPDGVLQWRLSRVGMRGLAPRAAVAPGYWLGRGDGGRALGPRQRGARAWLVARGRADAALELAEAAGAELQTQDTLRGHAAPVLFAAWSCDEQLLASADAAGSVLLWKRADAANGDGRVRA